MAPVPGLDADSLRARLADARLYLCTDARRSRGDLAEFADAALAGGVDIVQLRDKGPDGPLEARDELAALEVLADACARHGALLAVNDRADVALASGADVLHLGQDDLPVAWARKVVGDEVIVGRSAHSAAETAAAADEPGVDYFCAGPCWPTPTKPGRPAPGLDLVRTVAGRAPARPVVRDRRDRRRPARRGAGGRSRPGGRRAGDHGGGRPARGGRGAGRPAARLTTCRIPTPTRDGSGAPRAPEPRVGRARRGPLLLVGGRGAATRLRGRAAVALATLVARAAPGVGVGRRRRSGAARGRRPLLVRAEAGAGHRGAAVVASVFFEVVASVVGSSDVVSDVVVLFVDVSVLALFEPPSTLPSDVPPGRCDVELLLVFSGEPLTSSSPVIASMPIANTATVNPVITSSRRRDFGAPASTAGTAEMTSVA